jgi:hypothetical protein
MLVMFLYNSLRLMLFNNYIANTLLTVLKNSVLSKGLLSVALHPAFRATRR